MHSDTIEELYESGGWQVASGYALQRLLTTLSDVSAKLDRAEPKVLAGWLADPAVLDVLRRRFAGLGKFVADRWARSDLDGLYLDLRGVEELARGIDSHVVADPELRKAIEAVTDWHEGSLRQAKHALRRGRPSALWCPLEGTDASGRAWLVSPTSDGTWTDWPRVGKLYLKPAGELDGRKGLDAVVRPRKGGGWDCWQATSRGLDDYLGSFVPAGDGRTAVLAPAAKSSRELLSLLASVLFGLRARPMDRAAGIEGDPRSSQPVGWREGRYRCFGYASREGYSWHVHQDFARSGRQWGGTTHAAFEIETDLAGTRVLSAKGTGRYSDATARAFADDLVARLVELGGTDVRASISG